MKPTPLRIFLIASALEGAGVMFLLTRTPSEIGWLGGFSPARWGILTAVLLLTAAILWVLWNVSRPGFASQRVLSKADAFLNQNQHFMQALLFCLALAFFGFGGWLFSFLFIPLTLRWVMLWGALIGTQAFVALLAGQPGRARQVFLDPPRKALNTWRMAVPVQKSTLRWLFWIGLVYFVLWIIPNALDAFTPHDFYLNGGDEYITYPYVVWMLSPSDSMETAVYRFFIYEDYHYGYPFYFLSMLVLLPVRLIAGADFGDLTQLNLLLLRQFISVLPMILSAGVFTWLQTHFRHRWKSVAIFGILLLLGGVAHYNSRFWHPDALVVLCVALTILFLERDRFQYRANFLWAAVFCGLATAIKLFGVFFVLSIAGYLLAGLIRRVLTMQRAAVVSAAFVGVMAAVFLFSNPFLFFKDARQFAGQILQEKSVEVSQGYDEPDPEGVYQKGLAATLPHLREPYGLPFMLAFLLVSITAAFACGKNRLVNGVLLGWVLMSGSYLVFFSAIKNYHYWLPVMVPLFSGFFSLAGAARHCRRDGRFPAAFRRSAPAVERIVWLLAVFQIGWGIFQALPYWRDLARIGELIR